MRSGLFGDISARYFLETHQTKATERYQSKIGYFTFQSLAPIVLFPMPNDQFNLKRHPWGLLGPQRDASVIFLELVHMKIPVQYFCYSSPTSYIIVQNMASDRRQYSGVLKDPKNAFLHVFRSVLIKAKATTPVNKAYQLPPIQCCCLEDQKWWP